MERDLSNGQFNSTVYISTHTLTWSVTYEFGKNSGRLDISTHTLTWSVTKIQTVATLQLYISTHTLTWSVTFQKSMLQLLAVTISTHTLTWSVTRFTALTLYYTNFNSHAHVERDRYEFGKNSGRLDISTHTLTWSVT